MATTTMRFQNVKVVLIQKPVLSDAKRRSCHSNLFQLSKMADFTSEQFLTKREEKCILILFYKSANLRNETAGGYHECPKRRIIKMEVSNLRPSALTQDQIKALAVCLPSLQCGPRTDDEHFDQMWCKERLKVHQFSSTFQLNLIPPSAVTAGAERTRPQQPDSSQSLLVTAVHPEEIDMQALANAQNHFDFITFEGRGFVRVTSSVNSPEGRQSPSSWRVSDYNLEGQKILSVICTMTKDLKVSCSQERCQSEPEESRMTT